ncbi:MAG: hypothetical protein KC457_15780, partial [Myxococcales bacterium]|nr:hypothetical protein [Myxococcales bacterium]
MNTPTPQSLYFDLGALTVSPEDQIYLSAGSRRIALEAVAGPDGDNPVLAALEPEQRARFAHRVALGELPEHAAALTQIRRVRPGAGLDEL